MKSYNTKNFDLIAIFIEKRWLRHKLVEMECFGQHIRGVYLTDYHLHRSLMRLVIRLEEYLFDRPMSYNCADFDSHNRHILAVEKCLQWRLKILEELETTLKTRSD
jgi:hypothetical protein